MHSQSAQALCTAGCTPVSSPHDNLSDELHRAALRPVVHVSCLRHLDALQAVYCCFVPDDAFAAINDALRVRIPSGAAPCQLGSQRE